MSAQDKLNAAFINGSLLVAGLAGVATQSWGIFIGTMLGMLLLNVTSGRIRSAADDIAHHHSIRQSEAARSPAARDDVDETARR